MYVVRNAYIRRMFIIELKNMVKLKFKIKDHDVECDGTVEEIQKLLSSLIRGDSEIRLGRQRPEINLKEKIPAQEKLINYIISKPNFEHNIFEIQEYFFGKHFGSRGDDGKQYNALYRRLVRVREKIEKDYNGKFQGEWSQTADGELYKIFRFVKKPEVT